MSYGGDVNRGPFLNTLNWILQAFSLVAVILRLLSHRLRDKHDWGVDDLLIVLAVAIHLARSILLSISIEAGFGRHLPELLEHEPAEKVTHLLHELVVLQAIGLWTFAVPKLPVVALLVRLFGRVTRHAVALYASALALIVLVTVITITTFVQCTPVAAQWDTSLHGKCWNRDINVDLGYLAGGMLTFRLYSFWKLYGSNASVLHIRILQMERSRKALIAGSMSLGFLGGIVTVYKLTTIHQINDTLDPTWATVPLEVWNSVEGCALILAACGPMVRPLINSLFQSIWMPLSRLGSNFTNTQPSQTTDLPTTATSAGATLSLSSTADDGVTLLKQSSHQKRDYSQVEMARGIPLAEMRKGDAGGRGGRERMRRWLDGVGHRK
ncbi:hypothetical protein BO70DRAFT_396328 [Aspergillus heteromorphus CBS 117.55]|uniref:Rhodopsin domain-containing protein n=1 Tax=Aspergillus heteromorphus CBS 117.55 TaxID=1448321 RepID=A0A317W604_9EURO|nr:uncharacterized protein BO70DRAFT_396328 [Aspergillus heteromorphus CBS 117.55]PWY82036.1 hypothetical protein BO70DRAFT_396328 [Aspergillus heteromorphus CBS 117.55]